MKKILIICSQYAKNNDASGICIKNIAEELIKEGNKVFIISEGPKTIMNYTNINDVKVWYVKTNNLFNHDNKKQNIISNIFKNFLKIFRRLIVFMFYPNVSFIRSKKVLNLSKIIIKKYNIDIVIGSYRPFESLNVALKLKKIYKEKLKVIAYHLDLILEPVTKNKLIKIYKIYKGERFIKNEIKFLDMLLLPKSASKKFISDKINYVDFPLFLDNKCQLKESNYNFSSDNFNIVYIGTIDNKNRSLEYIYNFLSNLENINNKKIVLHIWGKLDSITIKRYVDNNNIIYHGFVENEYVRDILEKSDCLLNLSNIITYKMIPSKIFQLFSIKKPIINIIYNKNDSSIDYFEKSNISFNIFYDRIIDEKLKMDFLIFLNNFKKERLNKNIFVSSMPSYTTNLIVK